MRKLTRKIVQLVLTPCLRLSNMEFYRDEVADSANKVEGWMMMAVL